MADDDTWNDASTDDADDVPELDVDAGDMGDMDGADDHDGDDDHDHDDHDDRPDADITGESEEVMLGQVLMQDGLSESGNPVAYSTSYNEYYDTVTHEEVEPK